MACSCLMEIPFTGGCLCGAFRYVCRAHPLSMHNCHCRDCQQVTGGAYAPVLVVPLSALEIPATGHLQRHVTIRINGRRNVRGFCATCGSPVTVGEDPERDRIGLMAGSLDNPAVFRPARNIFICDAQPWDVMDTALPQYPNYAPRR